MITTIHSILVLLALVCFLIASVGELPRGNLIAAGLFLWLLSTLVGGR